MADDSYKWYMDETTVSDLLWSLAHLDRILPGLSSSSASPAPSPQGTGGNPNLSVDEERLPSPPLTPRASKPRESLYSRRPDSSVSSTSSRGPSDRGSASPVRLPDLFPLPRPSELSKALLPFARRVPGHVATTLDIDATVDQTAEANGLPVPVFRPPLQRWFDLYILMDHSPSMDFWGDLAEGLVTLFRWQGMFRDVRVWQFETDESAVPRLFSGVDRVERTMESLLTPGRDRLFVVFTDTLGHTWRSGRAFDALAILGAKHPVVLAHVFPQSLWRKTALESAVERPLFAPYPGCANRHLMVQESLLSIGSLLRFPIMNLSVEHLQTWARHIAVEGGSSIQGVLVRQNMPVSDQSVESDYGDSTSVEEMVDLFLLDASPEAGELAGVLAAIPLIPSVMRLAQRRFMPDTEHWHLAEVFFSGLIQRSDAGPKNARVTDSWYEFREGIREVLLNNSSVLRTAEVWQEMGDFIARQFDSSRDFSALVPNEAGTIRDADLDPSLYFAAVDGAVFKTWGGEFAKRGQILLDQVKDYQQNLHEIKQELVDWMDPSLLEAFAYESIKIIALPSEPTRITTTVTQYVQSTEPFPVKYLDRVRFVEDNPDEDQPSVPLEPFLIRVATVKQQDAEWVVTYEAAEARRYIETLPNGIPLELVAIPSGQFVMGSPDDEPERYDDESPQHKVVIPSGFFMGRYPVTQAQWRVVESLPQVNRELNPDPSEFKGDDRPVESIDWHEAVEFCDRLNHYFDSRSPDFRDYKYRLPSEAEWEYACRAGTTTPFHFGSMITTEVANYDGSYTYADGPSGESSNETTPVTQFNHANRFGLSDMHGNVHEWCLDHWHDDYQGAPLDGSAWQEDPLHNNGRVFRGGSWNFDPRNCRSAFRNRYTPVGQDFNLGFRVVLAPR